MAASSCKRVGVRLLKHADADGVAAVEAQVQRVVLGAELRAADVAQQDQRAVVAALQHQLLELVGIGQPSRDASR